MWLTATRPTLRAMRSNRRVTIEAPVAGARFECFRPRPAGWSRRHHRFRARARAPAFNETPSDPDARGLLHVVVHDQRDGDENRQVDAERPPGHVVVPFRRGARPRRTNRK